MRLFHTILFISIFTVVGYFIYLFNEDTTPFTPGPTPCENYRNQNVAYLPARCLNYFYTH